MPRETKNGHDEEPAENGERSVGDTSEVKVVNEKNAAAAGVEAMFDTREAPKNVEQAKKILREELNALQSEPFISNSELNETWFGGSDDEIKKVAIKLRDTLKYDADFIIQRGISKETRNNLWMLEHLLEKSVPELVNKMYKNARDRSERLLMNNNVVDSMMEDDKRRQELRIRLGKSFTDRVESVIAAIDDVKRAERSK